MCLIWVCCTYTFTSKDHFWVAKSLCFKARLNVKMNFYCRAVNKKSFALSFVLKVRVFRIRKCPKFHLKITWKKYTFDQFIIELCSDALSVSATEYFSWQESSNFTQQFFSLFFSVLLMELSPLNLGLKVYVFILVLSLANLVKGNSTIYALLKCLLTKRLTCDQAFFLSFPFERRG